MSTAVSAALIGLASGVLSGAFGIGGGIVTTPAITLALGAPALIAVGTPLPVILPSAVTGVASYARHGLVDWRAGLLLGLTGSVTSVLGALLAAELGGRIVLLGTAALIAWAAADTLMQVIHPAEKTAANERTSPQAPAAATERVPGAAEAALELTPAAAHAPAAEQPAAAEPALAAPRLGPVRGLAIGALTGLYSGFFGLGGGFVLVPLLTRWGRYPLKRAIATSLAAVALLAIPGTVTHALLGHIDWSIALWLTVGVVPGAALGARISLGAGERPLRIGFAALLLVVGGLLASQQSGLI